MLSEYDVLTFLLMVAVCVVFTIVCLFTLAFLFSELFSLVYFRHDFVSSRLHEYPLKHYHDTSEICRTGHEAVSC